MDTNALFTNWTKIKEMIRDEYGIGPVSYETWIKNLELQKIEGDVITISIPSENAMMLSYINTKYREIFQAALSEELNRVCEVVFVLNQGEKEDKTEQPKAPAYNLNSENANLNSKYRFTSFVVGSNNRLAHSACLAVAESPGDVYNPLFLYGGAGLGKTHLMHSIGHFVLEQNPEKRVLYVTSEQFTNEVIESIRSGNATVYMAKLRDRNRTVDVLLIDDIQFIIGKESTQEEFFHTFNQLHAAGKQIVLSSDRPPREMETLNERFRSRFEMGLIADIQPPDYETRMAILRKNMELQHYTLDDEILEYIASNIKSNIRELEGAYKKIIAFSKLNKVDINIDNAREALKEYIYPDQSQNVTPKMIANAVCEQYDVKMSMVASRKKNTECVVPRQVIMYLCREYTNETLDGVARLLGKKDHSTIMHGVDKIRSELETNDELRSNINIIKKKLNIT